MLYTPYAEPIWSPFSICHQKMSFKNNLKA
jgi:hypothetical protein